MVVAMGSTDEALAARIAERARRFGSLPWSAFMEAALYDPEGGFYQAGGKAGRHGDFVTSPELGSLFATACASALDQCWEDLRYPDPFVVVEAAAGVGSLSRDILAAEPACAPALRYVLVERSSPLRAAQVAHLPIEPPESVLGPRVAGAPDDTDDDEAKAQTGVGPLVTALAELPAVPFTGMILANELLDNLPVDLLEWRDHRWQEVRVAAAGEGPELVEVLVPAPAALAAEADRLTGAVPVGQDALVALREGSGEGAVGEGALGGVALEEGARRRVALGRVALGGGALEEGARVPLQRAAQEWLRRALVTLQGGSLVLIDYADTTAAMARRPWPEWLRTFRQHEQGLTPLEAPGTQDITCVVAVDQLAAVRPPSDDRSQADWLEERGIPILVQAARETWNSRAAIGDLAALKARSRVGEAEALMDPAGLGGHRVLQWVAGRR
ncbi:MAG TPA: SAM-dependent methyltransferase [Acidimicrobiales bacterium]|jgi:SAM-dependent MidA family methyltransferase|nr:SAM-dependent methyltransferase [Acidimicrobiales bacterium]